MKWELDENLSGKEVYYTACFLLVISKKTCSKLHCQKGFNRIPVSHKIRELGVGQGQCWRPERVRHSNFEHTKETALC